MGGRIEVEIAGRVGDLKFVPNLLGVMQDVGDVAWMCGRGGVVQVETEFFFDTDAVRGGGGGVAERILPGLEVLEGGDLGADGDVLAGVVSGEAVPVHGLEVERSDFGRLNDFVDDGEIAPVGPVGFCFVNL